MPRPSIAAERREEILQAFETCALRKGLEATTLADVAEEAGLPRPLVRHFMGNRAEMVSGLIERMMQRASQAIEQALDASGTTREADPYIGHNGYVVAPQVGTVRELAALTYDDEPLWTLELPSQASYTITDEVVVVVEATAQASTLTVHG